jgi:hypothetical protein
MEHKIGDLVMRPYMEQDILGWVSDIGENNMFPYEIEWMQPKDNVTMSLYDLQSMREAKRRLNEYLRTQNR